MTTAKPLSHWQRAAALAAEGACLLPPLLAALWNLWRLPLPPSLSPVFPAAWLPALSLVAQALVYGLVLSPLRLWRVAVYRRLCGEARPFSLRLAAAAVGWRWHLWWRRTGCLAIAVLPAALLWIGGDLAAQSDTLTPLLWLIGGGAALVGGVIAVAVWQCRFALAPLYLLDGLSAEQAAAESARRMRAHTVDYINFLGGEAPRLLACVFLVPAIWLLPDFRLRRTELLLSWMQPTV